MKSQHGSWRSSLSALKGKEAAGTVPRMTRPVDVVRKLCPRAKPSYVSAFEHGDGLFMARGITSPLRLAHFLAQAFHETGGLTIEWESGAYSAPRLLEIFGVGHHSAAITPSEASTLAYDGPAIFERVYGLGNPRKAKELGNTQPGDGYKYRGGGILQTTGRANYRRMGQKCGVDFEGHPELVLSAEHALKPALAEWAEGNLNAAADRDDILAITKKINGGTNGLDSRKDWLRKIKPLVLNVDLKPLPDAPVPPPPDIAPIPHKPADPAVHPKTMTGLAAIIAGIAAALSSSKVEIAIGIVAAAIVVAVAVHFLWPKKE